MWIVSQAMFFGSALVSPNITKNVYMRTSTSSGEHDLLSPNITKKVYMRTSTSSGNDRNGAKENKGEHDKKENVTDGGK